jgi:cytochrome c-type biogenesis protein CcmI
MASLPRSPCHADVLVVAGLLLAGAAVAAAALRAPRAASAGPAGGANVAVSRPAAGGRRDLASDVITPERFEQLRGEIQRRVLEDTQLGEAPVATLQPARRMALALALLIPAASIATYWPWANPAPPRRSWCRPRRPAANSTR